MPNAPEYVVKRDLNWVNGREVLWDRFICGLRSEAAQKQLLTLLWRRYSKLCGEQRPQPRSPPKTQLPCRERRDLHNCDVYAEYLELFPLQTTHCAHRFTCSLLVEEAMLLQMHQMTCSCCRALKYAMQKKVIHVYTYNMCFTELQTVHIIIGDWYHSYGQSYTFYNYCRACPYSPNYARNYIVATKT